MLFLCHQRYRSNKEQQARARDTRTFRPHSHENPFVMDLFAYSDPRYSAGTVSCQNNWKKHSFLRTTGKQTMDHTENGFATQELDGHQNNIWNDTPYKTRNPHLAGINPGTIVNCRDGDPEDHPVRQPYRPKPRQTPYGDGTAKGNHSLIVAPSRAYLPTPGWRLVDEVPTPSSIYLDTLSVAEDNELDHQLLTLTSITRPETVIYSNQGYNWDPSANKPCSYRTSVDPEACMTTLSGSEDNRGHLAAARQKPPFNGLHQSSPPPRPPKSPLRKAPSTWTVLDVSFLPDLSFRSSIA